MADDKTTKTPEQPVTDSGPGKETPPAPPKEPEKVSVSPEPEKKTEPEVKNPQVSVYNFAEIMKEKKVEERAAAPSGEKPAPAKTEKPEKQPEAPKKAEEKPKEPEQPKRRGRPPKADKDKSATPKPEAPAQKPENAVKKEPEKKTAPTVQAAPAPKEPEKPKDGQFSRIPMKLSLTSRPLTLCRKSVGMSDATRTAGAKQLPSQACFIVPIAAARCMSTVPTTASVFLNIPVPNKDDYQTLLFLHVACNIHLPQLQHLTLLVSFYVPHIVINQI